MWGPKGGPGRTTVAVNLAFEAAAAGGEVLLVDADTYGGAVAHTNIQQHRRNPKGALTGSCSSPILVDQATEQVSSMNAAVPALIYERLSGGWVRRLELQRPVRPVPVVALDVDSHVAAPGARDPR